MAHRQELIDIEKKMHFSYDLEETLADEERAADQILLKLRKQELKDDAVYNTVIHNYFENFVSLKKFTNLTWSDSSLSILLIIYAIICPKQYCIGIFKNSIPNYFCLQCALVKNEGLHPVQNSRHDAEGSPSPFACNRGSFSRKLY